MHHYRVELSLVAGGYRTTKGRARILWPFALAGLRVRWFAAAGVLPGRIVKVNPGYTKYRSEVFVPGSEIGDKNGSECGAVRLASSL
jgi:hypothetical protein